MGRRAEGWKLRTKRGWYYVCFTHAATEHRVALGTRDGAEAARLAPGEYAAVVSGRRSVRAGRPSSLLDLEAMMGEYLASLVGSHSPSMVKTDVIHGRRVVAFFGSLDRVTEASVGDFSRARLRQVTKSTVKHERSFLAGFLRWAVEQGAIAKAPDFPALPRKATGTRASAARSAPVAISADEARAILDALPALSKSIGGRRWPIRARFIVAWETGLRPATLARLSTPRHYTRGATELELFAEDDKARFARRVPLSDEARRQLDAALPLEGGLLFGAHSFAKVLKRTAAKVLGAERARQFAQYDFRHGRASDLIDKGAPLTGVAFLFGHTKLSTTDKYLRGNRRAAERALDAVAGTFTDQAKAGEAKAMISRGDRRVSNPRQLDPQRSSLGKKLAKTSGPNGQRVTPEDASGPDIRTRSVYSAAGGLALQRVQWDLFDAFADDADGDS